MSVKKLFQTLLLGLALSCTAEATDIRVAVVEGQATVALQAKAAFIVQDLATGEERTLTKGKYFVHVQDGSLLLEKEAFGRAVSIKALEGKELPNLNGRAYDGTLQLQTDDTNVLATNIVDLEQLLCRVLPNKTMPIWPEEAIKAQAVAARSYLLYQKAHNAAKGYDIKAIDKELPYFGLGPHTEKPAISKLIKATAGQYVGDSYDRPIFAVSTSSSGGKTETGLAAYAKDYSYLQSVADADEDSPEYKWDFRISPEYVKGILEQNGYALGKLVNVRLSPMDKPGSDRTATGRVKYIIFGGTLGTATLTGVKVAELFNLNSSCFDLETGTPAPESIKVPIENRYGMEIGKKEIPIKVKEEKPKVVSEFLQNYHTLKGGKDERIMFHGKGKGLGAGLSAWGARGLASGEEPKSYEEILAHYYPGTHVVK